MSKARAAQKCLHFVKEKGLTGVHMTGSAAICTPVNTKVLLSKTKSRESSTKET
jgi:hypothetical protein